MTTTNHDVNAEVKRAKKDIVSLLAWIECELDNQDCENCDWGDFGSLGKVRGTLAWVLADLTGSETDEIFAHLKEHNDQA